MHNQALPGRWEAHPGSGRYPTHAAYVASVRKVTLAAEKAGYILPFDADATIREAVSSRIGARKADHAVIQG